MGIAIRKSKQEIKIVDLSRETEQITPFNAETMIRGDGRYPETVRMPVFKTDRMMDGMSTAFIEHGQHIESIIYGPIKVGEGRGKELCQIDLEVILGDADIVGRVPTEETERIKEKRIDTCKDIIKETIFPIIMTELYPQSFIRICVYIEKDDKSYSTISMAINSILIALLSSSIMIRDVFAACSFNIPKGSGIVCADNTIKEEILSETRGLVVLSGRNNRIIKFICDGSSENFNDILSQLEGSINETINAIKEDCSLGRSKG